MINTVKSCDIEFSILSITIAVYLMQKGSYWYISNMQETASERSASLASYCYNTIKKLWTDSTENVGYLALTTHAILVYATFNFSVHVLHFLQKYHNDTNMRQKDTCVVA